MKQNISKSDWNELSEEQKKKFAVQTITYCNCTSWRLCDCGFPNIGQMIEFLGDDLTEMFPIEEQDGWQVELGPSRTFFCKELVDALWEAVKSKLIK